MRRIDGFGLLVVLLALVGAGCNLSTAEVADLPTVTVTVFEVSAKPTRTPIPLPGEVRPTPLAALSTLPPPPLPLATVGGNATVPGAPDQAVLNYYALVSQGRYDLAWSMLTDTFKQKFNCCAPAYNYADYVAWWDSVDRVEFGTVKTVSQSGERAVVHVEMYYLMNTGARSSLVGDPYIELVYDSSLNAWRFNDKRANA